VRSKNEQAAFRRPSTQPGESLPNRRSEMRYPDILKIFKILEMLGNFSEMRVGLRSLRNNDDQNPFPLTPYSLPLTAYYSHRRFG
jgi:hypothetical protein